jgi:hypothetical protein
LRIKFASVFNYRSSATGLWKNMINTSLPASINHHALYLLAIIIGSAPSYGYAETITNQHESTTNPDVHVRFDFGVGVTDGIVMDGVGSTFTILLSKKNLFALGVRLRKYGILGTSGNEIVLEGGLNYEYRPIIVSALVGYGKLRENTEADSASDNAFGYDLRLIWKTKRSFGFGYGYTSYFNKERRPRSRTVIFSWSF